MFVGQSSEDERFECAPEGRTFDQQADSRREIVRNRLGSLNPLVRRAADTCLERLHAVLGAAKKLQLRTVIVNQNVGVPVQLHRIDVLRYLRQQIQFALIGVWRRRIKLHPSTAWRVDLDPAMRVRLTNDVIAPDRIVLAHEESIDQSSRNSYGA